MEPIFELKNIFAGYGKIIIVEDVTLQIGKGEIVLLIGPNGSGKSTLVKTIFKLASLFQGKIVYDGNDITNLAPEDIARMGIGYVPQTDNVFHGLTIEENLVMGSFARSKDYESLEADLESMYSMFPPLYERRKQKARVLSGGEKQMLAIARSLVGRPRILILDEPIASLAPKRATEVLEKIVEIRDTGTTILLISHVVKKPLELANRVYILVSGRKVFEGESSELLEETKLTSYFLGGHAL